MNRSTQNIDELFERASRQWEKGNLRSAFRLFLAAAKLGDIGAQLNLGNFYADGIGIRPNRRSALLWYRKAYKGGMSAAASNIANLYQKEGNSRKAMSWYGCAVKMGDADANVQLAKMFLGSGNMKAAKTLLRNACRAGVDDITPAGRQEAKRLLRRVRG